MDQPSRKAEFAELLRDAQSRLFGYVHSLVRDMDDADDLFQQTAAVLWKKFDEFDRSRSFLGWACGVARLEAMNFLRGRGRQKLYLSDDLNLLLIEAQEEMSAAEADDRRDALSKCVEKLRRRDRELLEACYGDRGVNEVARRERRSPQSVHNSLRRIRRALFECVQRTMREGTS